MRAALGRAQLAKIEANNARRQALVWIYRYNLAKLPGWIIPFARYSGSSSYHLMVAVAPDKCTRGRVAETLKKLHIQTSLHYPYIPGFRVFEPFRSAGLLNSREFAERAITLPLYPSMTAAQVEAVCAVLAMSAF
jgi:dTDP-4-amino-4,6-dideoxygalactose transaminase